MNPANRNEQRPDERCYLQVMKCKCIVKERDLNPPRPRPEPIVIRDPCANLKFDDPDLDFGEVERNPGGLSKDVELVPVQPKKYQYQGNTSQGNQSQGYQYQGYQYQDDPYQGNSFQEIQENPYEEYDGFGNIERRDTRNRSKRNANASNVKWGKSCMRKFF